ncbi:MAG: pyrroline-5-carboxylate reductase [Lachnospiraceae bacterium]|jgi:pyrroline-5-carboxylate reductase|nr:pyrroline-5-carboxylate reductase [Lachnospiraceae bacterium]
MINKKFAIIGYGNMAGAIFGGAIKKGLIDGANLYAFDPSDVAREKMKADGINVAGSGAEACEMADIVFLSVKPQYAEAAISECGDKINNKSVFSIMAGLSVERIKKLIQGNARVLRVMPNTPALVFEGAFALVSDTDITEEEKTIAEELFSALGLITWVEERLIDAVCGLSGGGPAWVAMFIEAMVDAGVGQGLPRKVASDLTIQTVLGSAKLLLETGMHTAALKDMVTSPGGTTIEGCKVLEEAGFRGGIMDCVEAATEKSKAL